MLVSPSDLERLRRDAAAADRAGALTLGQRARMHRRGWLKLLAPKALGGGELPLPEMVRLEEQLAQADGSVAWVVTLCAGAGFFAGFLDPALGRELLATPRLCIGGSGAVGGQAQREGAGWRLQGEWAQASGAPLCTHFTLNARLHHDGQVLLDALGQPQVRAFVLPATQVRLLPSWHSLGLRASASQGFVVEGAWVADCQAFDISAEAATAPGPLYRFPFMPLAFATLAANLCGLARAFVQEAEAAIARPRTQSLLPRLHAATDALDARRAQFYAALDTAWADLESQGAVQRPDALSDAARALVAEASASVNALYPLCGLAAADPRTALNRIWRDFHTATQHAIWLPAPKMAA